MLVKNTNIECDILKVSSWFLIILVACRASESLTERNSPMNILLLKAKSYYSVEQMLATAGALRGGVSIVLGLHPYGNFKINQHSKVSTYKDFFQLRD